jgi:outer membrane protein assembly factor BamB
MNFLPSGVRRTFRRSLGVLFGIALVMGSGGCLGFYNTLPETSDAARRLSAGQPGPVWQSPLQGREVDLLHILPNGTVLAGTLWFKEGGALIQVDNVSIPQDLMLIDGKTGNVLWKVPRTFSPSPGLLVMVTEPLLVLRSDIATDVQLFGIDPVTGAVRWQWKSNNPGPVAVINQARAVIAAMNSGSVELSAVDLASGNQLWTSRLEQLKADAGSPVQVQAVDGGIVVAGKRMVLLCSSTNGAPLWKYDAAEDAEPIVFPVDQGILVANGRNLSLVRYKDGAERWKTTLAGTRTELISPLGDLVLTVSTQGPGPGSAVKVSALNLATGAVNWSQPLEERLTSAIIRHDGALYFTTQRHLVSWSLADGKQRFTADLPAALEPSSMLADRLLVQDDRVLVGREQGVAGFTTSDGKPLFAHVMASTLPYTNDYLVRKGMEMLEVSGGGAQQTAAPAAAPPIPAPQDWGYRSAQNNQRYVYATTQQTLNSPTSSSSERMSALNRRELATQTALSAGQMQANIEFAAAAAQFGAAVGSAVAAMMQPAIDSYVRERFTIVNMQTEASFRTHQASLKGSFYIRPLYRDGWRLAVIDLRDGKRADLVLSPPNTGLSKPSVANLPAFVVDPQRNWLIAKGLGLDPNRFMTYEFIHGVSPDQEYKGWVLPYPSLLRYDLGSLPFRQAPSSLSELVAPSRVPEKDAALVRAAAKGDAEAVKRALDAGANVNARDELGRTALMLAARSMNADAVIALGDRGADPTLTDPEGYDAWEYMSLPPQKGSPEKSRSTMNALMQVYKRHKKQ